jgi:hypothetical protein
VEREVFGEAVGLNRSERLHLGCFIFFARFSNTIVFIPSYRLCWKKRRGTLTIKKNALLITLLVLLFAQAISLTAASTIQITVGTTISETINASDLSDTYIFSANTGDSLFIKATGSFTINLRLYGTNGEKLAQNASDETPTIQALMNTTGTYSLVVDSPGSSVGSYNITVGQLNQPIETPTPTSTPTPTPTQTTTSAPPSPTQTVNLSPTTTSKPSATTKTASTPTPTQTTMPTATTLSTNITSTVSPASEPTNILPIIAATAILIVLAGLVLLFISRKRLQKIRKSTH